MSNWIRDAEAALAGGAAANVESAAEIVEVHAPAVLDTAGARALLAPFFAAFMWSVTYFQSSLHSPLDPMSLLPRVLAYALTLRAIRLLWPLLQRLRLALKRKRYALVLTPEGLLFRAPDRDVVVPQSDILDIKEQAGVALGARATPRWADVYLVTRPESGRLFLALPPIFERTPKSLAERLMRWRRVAPEEAAPGPAAAPEDLPSRLWERAASGEQIPGVIAIRHGYRWLARGPYASMLLGVAVLDSYLRLPTHALRALDPTPALMLAVVLVIVPAGWALLSRSRQRRRRGLALVLTPSGLLTHVGKRGTSRMLWSSVTRAGVHARTSWSLLRGPYEARTVVVQRAREQPVQLAEDLLAQPIDVVAALCEVYRKRAAAAAEVQPPSENG